MDRKPIVLPNGVRLRDPEDFDTLRQDLFDGAKEEVLKAFPKSYGGVRLEVTDVDYEGPETFTPQEQHRARMEDGYLARKLRGTLRLVDEKTNEVLDEKRTSLMRVPWLTERGVFMHGGNDYGMIMQGRLLPGAYTRRTGSGLLETQFNVRPGSGRAFRLHFDPEAAQYHLGIGPGGSSQVHFYSLLKDLGVDDEELEQTWGPEVLERNRAKYDTRVLSRAYKHLVPRWKQTPDASREEQAGAVKAALEAAQIAASVAKRTLPSLFDRQKAAAWRAQMYGQSLGAEMLEKHAAAFAFEPDLAPDRLWAARLADHFDAAVEFRLLSTKRATIAVDLDGTLAESPEGDFDPEVVGDPVPAMLKRVKRWLADGKKVVVFTARAADPKNVPTVKAWLKEQGLEDVEVTNSKTPDLEEFWDDRAVAVERNTGVVKSAIVKQDRKTGKWKLWTADGKRVLGTHDTAQEAYKQEYAIQKSQERRDKGSGLHKKEERTATVKQSSAPSVEIGERKTTYWICPHCKQEIYEKHSRPKDVEAWLAGGPLIEIHLDCGGEFTPPPASPEELAALERWKTAQALPPTALEWQEDPLYDWDGTLIDRLDGDAKTYMDGLKAVGLTPLGESLKSQEIDVVTSRPPLFHPAIRAAAERLGLKLRDIHHGENQKVDVVRKLMRPLVDDDEVVVAALREHLGEEAVRHYRKTAAADARKLQLARELTEEPKSYEHAEAGNYAKGRLTWNGLVIRLENPKGSKRKGLTSEGEVKWEVKMRHDYGYIVGTTGVDGDAVDVFIGPHLDSEIVYIVDQIDQKTGEFDEHKCVLGARTKDQAREIYEANYSNGWKVGKITSMTFDQFKIWVKEPKKKPAAELTSVKVAGTAEDFQPDLSGEDMQEAYDAIYGKIKPQLASMKQWPDKWLPPGSDPLGWISWYRRYSDGERSDDDERQISRWKKFKARTLAQFLKNPTPRRAFALRYWAIDPLKYLPSEDAKTLEQEMQLYREKETQRWMAEKTASFTKDELLGLVEFLNREHGAGLPLVGDEATLEASILAWLGMRDPAATALDAAAEVYPEVA